MKKPSDHLKVTELQLSELEQQLVELANEYVDRFNWEWSTALEIAEKAIEVQLLIDLKDELENIA